MCHKTVCDEEMDQILCRTNPGVTSEGNEKPEEHSRAWPPNRQTTITNETNNMEPMELTVAFLPK